MGDSPDSLDHAMECGCDVLNKRHPICAKHYILGPKYVAALGRWCITEVTTWAGSTVISRKVHCDTLIFHFYVSGLFSGGEGP